MNLNPQNFVAAINQICDEKKIEPEIVLEAVKDALKAAYRKDFGNREQELEVILDSESGRATVLLVKTVVKEVENKHAEISLTDARQIKKSLKLGTKVKIDVTPIDYGRIASQAAKQVIVQKIQEAERMAIYEEYRDRSDELLNALVRRIDGRFVHLELDRTTAVLEPRDQIPRERYQPGQRTKVYLEKVEMTARGSMLKVSRTHPRFIFRLMELEIPEVRNGAVVVKAIARDPGVRCKLVVDSVEDNVDPVGACVGQRGVRIQNITDEVGGERIDVIEWSDDFDTLLKETLSPAKIDHILKHEKEKRVEVYVAEDQRALAIGKNGQNVRLASEIMGWEIDILNTAELEGEISMETKAEEEESDAAADSDKPKKEEQPDAAKKSKKKAAEKETAKNEGKSVKEEGSKEEEKSDAAEKPEKEADSKDEEKPDTTEKPVEDEEKKPDAKKKSDDEGKPVEEENSKPDKEKSAEDPEKDEKSDAAEKSEKNDTEKSATKKDDKK